MATTTKAKEEATTSTTTCCCKGVVYMAISIDGLIATKSGDVSFLDEYNNDGSGGPSNSKDNDPFSFENFLNSVDVIIMGRTTFEKVVSFGKQMWAYGAKPIIVQTSKSSDQFTASLPNWITTEKQIRVTCSSKRPQKLMQFLFASHNYKRAYVDGGHPVRAFLKEGCITKMILTTVPLLLRQGIPLFLHHNNNPNSPTTAGKSSNKSNRPAPPVTAATASTSGMGYGDSSILNSFMESQSNLDSSQSSNRSSSSNANKKQQQAEQPAPPPPIRWKHCLTKSYPNGLVTTKYISEEDTAVDEEKEDNKQPPTPTATTTKLNIKTPDGKIHPIDVDLSSDTPETIVSKVEKETGIKMDTTNNNAQIMLLKYKDKELKSRSSGGSGGTSTTSLKQYGIEADSTLVIDVITKLNVQVAPHDGGKTHQIIVDLMNDTPDDIKAKIMKQIVGTTTTTTTMMNDLNVNKLLLKYKNQELGGGSSNSTLKDYGIAAGSTLVLDLPSSNKDDPIIFVDIKSGTLFGTDRDIVIEKGVLTLTDQNNKEEFVEAAKDTATRDKILKLMLDCPSLGLATHMVIVKKDVDLEANEAKEKAKNMWGVKLKHREQNKKGEEFVFIDPKTGACGELSRTKMIHDVKFITPVVVAATGSATNKEETLEESEKDPNVYDKYISELRRIFGIKFE